MNLNSILGIVSWIFIIVAVILVLLSCVFFRRKEESELSSSVTGQIKFKVAVVLFAIGLIIKIGMIIL